MDKDGDGKPEHSFVILSNYTWPLGLAWKGGSLYITEVSRILRFDNIDDYALNKEVREFSELLCMRNVSLLYAIHTMESIIMHCEYCVGLINRCSWAIAGR